MWLKRLADCGVTSPCEGTRVLRGKDHSKWMRLLVYFTLNNASQEDMSTSCAFGELPSLQDTDLLFPNASGGYQKTALASQLPRKPSLGGLLFPCSGPLTAQTSAMGVFCLISFLSSHCPDEAFCALDKTIPLPQAFLCGSVRARVPDDG